MLYGSFINNPAEARRKQTLKNVNRLFADDLTKLDCAGIEYYSNRKNFTL